MEILPWLGYPLLAAIIAALLLRHRGRISVSFRLLGGVAVARDAPKVCPHLGIAEDPFMHRSTPFADHRCYLWMQRDRIDLAHQKGFCLSVAHQQCPWLHVVPAEVAALPWERLSVGLNYRLGPLGPLAYQVARRGYFGLHALAAFLRPRLRHLAHAGQQWLYDHAPVLANLLRAGLSRLAALSGRAGRTAWTWIWLVGIPSLVAASTAPLRRLRPRRRIAPAPRPVVPSTVVPATPPSPLATAVGPTPAGFPAMPVGASQGGESVEDLIQRARTAAGEGKRLLAQHYLSLAGQMAPQNHEVWIWKAVVSTSASVKTACLERAAGLNPDSLRIYNEIVTAGVVAPAVAETPAPRKEAAPALGVDTDEDALLHQGLAALEARDEELAYRCFSMATQVNPRSDRSWFWRAKTASSLDEVVECLERALEANPDNDKVKTNLAWARERRLQERQRQRFAQPLGSAETSTRPSVEASRPADTSRPAAKQPSRPSLLAPITAFMNGLSGTLSLLLGFYWLVAATAPILGLSAQGLDPEGGLLRRFLPQLAAESSDWLTWAPVLELPAIKLAPDLGPLGGYDVMAAVPFVVVFMYLFMAADLSRGERWPRTWAALLTLGHLLLTLRYAANDQTALLGWMLALALGAALALGGIHGEKKARARELGPAHAYLVDQTGK